MRIMGIDCGTERTGYGVIDSDGRWHRMVTAGTIQTDAHNTLSMRLMTIASKLRSVIAANRPEVVAVEEVFHAANVKSALKLAHVRGVALLVASEAGLAVSEYSPLKIKQIVVGYGRAEKSQVQYMVRSLLGAAAPENQPDACDALAAAICHATLKKSIEAYSQEPVR